MRTVRSAAWSRNRPRRRVAWLLLAILLVLIALVARVDSAPASRDADALRGAPLGAARAAALDDDDDEDDEDGEDLDEDRAARQAAIDDGEDEEDLADRGDPADRGLAALAGEIAPDAEDAGDSANLARGSDADELGGLILDGDDAGAPAELALDDDAGSAGAGALALLDAELAPGDATAELDAADARATAGAEETYEQWMRHRRPSPWGRVDVGVSWRRRWSEPVHTPASRHDEIWLVATWRR